MQRRVWRGFIAEYTVVEPLRQRINDGWGRFGEWGY
jgi:hypothetical protein